MLQQRIYAYRSGKKVNYNSQQNEIPGIKRMFPEYRNIYSLVIQDVTGNHDTTPHRKYSLWKETKDAYPCLAP